MSFQRRRSRGHPTQPEIPDAAQIRKFQRTVPCSQPQSTKTNELLKMVQPGHHHGYQPAPPHRPPSARSTSRRASQFRPPSREKTSYNLYESRLSQGSSTDNPSRDVYSRASSVSVSRPSSSLSKYNPLPPIGYRTVHQFETDIGDTTDLSNSFRKLSVDICVPSGEDSSEACYSAGYNKSTDFTRQTLVTQGRRETTSTIQTRQKTTLGEKSSHVNRVMSPNRTEKEENGNVTAENLTLDILSPGRSDDRPEKLTIALKLPDGRRFQQCFPVASSLQSVLQFVETESGLNFNGFSLIQNSPKRIFNDLSQTLVDCQLEDRTLLYIDKDD
ncbi:UBX domain-containing protein 10-like [Liolophura sinensis]|uniref:UBX domain-containing protein 10-like n=1 Tax=Liolophura sinensis TaxID=3198878 RepID=UPI003158E288